MGREVPPGVGEEYEVTAIDEARFLIMATSGFEESELFGPRAILMERGARVVLASPTLAPIQGTVMDDPGRTIRPDMVIGDVVVAEHDALILPGGVINPDALRGDAKAVGLVRAFVTAGKPVGAICHGPWLLVEADVVRGRRVTGWRSILTDLRNAGGIVVDEAAVTDGMIVTSRSPEDVAAFTAAMIDLVRRV
jgi:protease I